MICDLEKKSVRQHGQNPPISLKMETCQLRQFFTPVRCLLLTHPWWRTSAPGLHIASKCPLDKGKTGVFNMKWVRGRFHVFIAMNECLLSTSCCQVCLSPAFYHTKSDLTGAAQVNASLHDLMQSVEPHPISSGDSLFKPLRTSDGRWRSTIFFFTPEELLKLQKTRFSLRTPSHYATTEQVSTQTRC